VITGLFRNWRLRTGTPAFAAGEEIRAYLTGFDPDTGEGTVRIGDTVLTVESASAAQVDQLVELRVESFNVASATGRAALKG
jgi:hypothetical protein